MRSRYGVEIHIYQLDLSHTTKRFGAFSYKLNQFYDEWVTDLHRGIGFNFFYLGISLGFIRFAI